MRVVLNRFIPFGRFIAVTLWPFIFCKKVLTYVVLNHERIHGEQQKELLLVFFYVWYFLEWLLRLILYRDFYEAYRNISFEQEAYECECDPFYLERRKMFGWVVYLSRKTFKK